MPKGTSCAKGHFLWQRALPVAKGAPRGKGRSSWQRALLVAKEASLKRVVGEDRRGGAVCDNMSILKKDGALTCG